MIFTFILHYIYHDKQTRQKLSRHHHPPHQHHRRHHLPTVLHPSFSTDSVVKRLANINTTRAVALAVVVNSPGGLPVQSEIISEKLQSYSKKHNLKLYTFARDIAASGGYMILSAGDHVVADTTSIVGSIGVVIQKMHFQGILDKLHFDHKQFNTQEYT